MACQDILLFPFVSLPFNIAAKKNCFDFSKCDDSWRLGEAIGAGAPPSNMSEWRPDNQQRLPRSLHSFPNKTFNTVLNSIPVLNPMLGTGGRLFGWGEGDYDQDRVWARHHLTLAWWPWHEPPTCCNAMSHGQGSIPFTIPLTSVTHITEW